MLDKEHLPAMIDRALAREHALQKYYAALDAEDTELFTEALTELIAIAANSKEAPTGHT